MTVTQRVLSLALILLALPLGGQSVIPVSDATLTGSYRMTADNTYLLDGPVIVEAGDTLTIEAGTLIGGRAVSTVGDYPASLIIAAGAVLQAEGTAENPIVLTSEREALGLQGELTDTTSWWGGLYILGRAPLTEDGSGRRTASYPGRVAGDPRASFGGDDLTDASGNFRYLSIRHVRGNGLNLLAVGRQSTFFRTSSFLEAYRTTGNGFYFEGGRNFYDHLVAAGNAGAAFSFGDADFSQGQYWLGVRTELPADSTAAPLLVAHTDLASSTGGPGTRPLLRNVSLISYHLPLPLDVNPPAAYHLSLTGNSSLTLSNALLVNGAAPAIRLESLSEQRGSYYQWTAGNLFIEATTLAGEVRRPAAQTAVNVVGIPPGQAAPVGEELFASSRNQIRFGAPVLGADGGDSLAFSPLLPLNSTLLNVANGLAGNGFSPASQAGAFDTIDWTRGWTALAAPAAGLQEINGVLLYGQDEFSCGLEDLSRPVREAFVQVRSADHEYLTTTNADGSFFLRLPPGEVTLSGVPPSRAWEPCEEEATIDGAAGETATIKLGLTENGICALPRVSIASLGVTPEGRSVYEVAYGNLGSDTAVNTRIRLRLDTNLVYEGANVPGLSLPEENEVEFLVGRVSPTERQSFEIYVTPRPGIAAGREVCTTVTIRSETDCGPVSSAQLEVTGSCDPVAETVQFTVRNVGPSPTVGPVPYIIVEDEVILNESTLNLGVDQTVVFPIEEAGTATYHFSTLATPDSLASSFVAATVSCDGTPTIPRAAYPATDLNSNTSTDCQFIGDLTLIREKTATPLGVTVEQLVPQQATLTYRLAYRNTLSDTLTVVSLRDTLAGFFDPATLEIGACSQPVTWRLEDNVLSVLQVESDLPPDSLGYVTFSVRLKDSIPDGSMVINRAWVRLDGEFPAVTNPSFHTVGRLYDHLLPIVNFPSAELPELVAYPVPASDRVHVTVPTQLPRAGGYVVYDQGGRRLRTGPYWDRRFTVDVSDLRPGLYFCSSISLSGRPTGWQRFVVQ